MAPCSDSLSLRLAYRLASPLRKTSRLIMQKARCQAYQVALVKRPPTACKRTVSGTISLPSQGCFSPFPHGTGSLSVAGNVFSLGRWSSRFPAGFHVSRGTQEPDKGASLVSPTGLAPCIADHSRSFGYEIGFLLPGATAVAPSPALQHPRYNASRLDISKVWTVPSSLAATGGIAIAFCSSGY